MKLVVDNQIVKMFLDDAAQIMKNSFISNVDNSITLRWPSLLEYLDQGSLLANLPVFDQTNPLFQACIATLCVSEEKEVLFHIYDHLFVENLNQIKSLPQINAEFLLEAIQEKRRDTVLSPALESYETSLRENSSHTMHDLILYLAWDRMCVWMARLFDYQSTDPKFIKGITILKECLIESYQHIAQQGRTSPGIYRMLESLVFYEMREENLQNHTEAEWTLLSQSFQSMKVQDELIDFFYIDEEVTPVKQTKEICYLTSDSPKRVNSRLLLAQFMLDKLKTKVPEWSYVLHPSKIDYFYQTGFKS